MDINYQTIGEFHSELSPQTGAPRQGALTPENRGSIQIYPSYQEGLKDIGKCSHIIALYHMHLSKNWHSMVRPPNSQKEFGLFATRSPNRPNSIGFAVLKLEKVENGILYVSGVDAFDGTPVLDIKPWLASIDCPDHAQVSDTEKELGIEN